MGNPVLHRKNGEKVMSTKHLRDQPHRIDDFTWWYEEPEGIVVVVWSRDKMLGRNTVGKRRLVGGNCDLR